MISTTEPMENRAKTTEALFINGKKWGEMNYHSDQRSKPYHTVIRLQFGDSVTDYALIQGFGKDRKSAIKDAVKESMSHHLKCIRAIQDFYWEISQDGES